MIKFDESNTKAEEDAYYEREVKMIKEFSNTIDFESLFETLRQELGIKSLNFRKTKCSYYDGKFCINFDSKDDIVNRIGIMRFALKECKISIYGHILTDIDNSVPFDYNRDYSPYYYCGIYVSYTHHDGGKNASEIANAVYKNGKWEIDFEKDR